jgi:site-specific DNA-methyltransferase (adenine-specific)
MDQVKRYPTVVLHIDEIKPYWRNPRRVGEAAISALAQSIQEFGYKQPIVVDSEHVIIVGHTRYAALRRLDVTQVPVKVVDGLSPVEVKQLRIIDNRVAELTSWDLGALAEEIGELDSELLVELFPDLQPEAGTSLEAGTAGDELPGDGPEPDRKVELICVHCFHSFELLVTREAIMSGEPLRVAAAVAGEQVAS